MKFIQLIVQEKFGGNHNGSTPEYRALLLYKYERYETELEIHGYGVTPAAAAAEAWKRYEERK